MLDGLRRMLRNWLFADTVTVTLAPLSDANAIPGDDTAAARLAPYDAHLLERARTQWQFGDWASLARIERAAIEHHPDRARLALLVATAHMQLHQLEPGRQFARLAQDYGCARKLIAQVLVSGVHNSLGRAALANGAQQRAMQHFEHAIALGAPGADAALLVQARAREQYTQLHNAAPTERVAKAASIHFVTHACSALPAGLASDFFVAERQDAALAALTAASNTLVTGAAMPAVEHSAVTHRDKTYYFAHFEHDYIPEQIRASGKFYEAPFLNLLARLHEPGRLIIDGGANLGNHSVFFAGVMKAQVIAFEPQPHNHLLLCANRALNQLDALIDIRAHALGAQAGTVTLRLAHARNYGSFTATGAAHDAGDAQAAPGQSAAEQGAGFRVPVKTLDAELAAQSAQISILKLDIEGMELDALHGASTILERSKPVLAVECFSKVLYAEIRDYLARFDYFVIDSVNATPTFIFLNRGNAFHMTALASHLERNSVDKLKQNSAFNRR